VTRDDDDDDDDDNNNNNNNNNNSFHILRVSCVIFSYHSGAFVVLFGVFSVLTL
jgi:hypothetical protein